eukprot:CAMPEP_0183524452 /NCGR_PEP_ID=MMETSP0371-20130417/19902_1 /TAXON_ID=268820 /ORGANISM="Peridinium aciculiferum, Strain PAER-2" /LENGTH=266 /DNA_ID=CAMNT_0025723557 /DNA_START=36 /DNA_END=836 /DNA_ORIENTATION=+
MAASAPLQMLTAQVERSIFPGLTHIPILRCPTAPLGTAHFPRPPAAAAAAASAAFDPPDLLDNAGSADASASMAEARVEGTLALGIAQVGTNCLVGGMYGLFSQLVRPGLQRISRRAGVFAPAVQIGGEAGAFGIAYAVTGLCKGVALRLGSIVTKIPILGSTGPVGSALQIGLASYLGNKVGELLLAEVAEEPTQPVFLANMCVMCNTPFVVGGGHTVAALSCGHACLCISDADGNSCAGCYLDQRSDCPLCRVSPVQIMHELRV